MASGDTQLMFAPFSSAVDVSFFQELSSRKLNDWGLSSDAKPIVATYTSARRAGDAPKLSVARESFAVASSAVGSSVVALAECVAPGDLVNVNTVGDFKKLDKNKHLAEVAAAVWSDIVSGAAEADPSRLLRFSVTSFADLKTHSFVYWFACPALILPGPVHVASKKSLAEAYPDPVARVQLRKGLGNLRVASAAAGQVGCPPFFVVVPGGAGSALRVLPLSALAGLDLVERRAAHIGMVDPCGVGGHPGWPLRNLLALAVKRWGLSEVAVLCYRSLLRRLGGPAAEADACDANDDASFLLTLRLPEAPELESCPPAVGWEANTRQKPGPRQMNLGALMDPRRLAEASADLNLRLMRWRAIPALDTDMLAATRVLLLGAGTLGCAVARTLLGWGVHKMAFVDNGRVSYSNPTRQSLFEFTDCADGGKPKALAAADALRRIYPAAEADAHALHIPMPGHSVEAEAAAAEEATATLERLVAAADVVFLLTDTRESRWLPTLLCAAADKPLIDVALGMDSFLVLRHGAGPTPAPVAGAAGGAQEAAAPSPRLGCYFW